MNEKFLFLSLLSLVLGCSSAGENPEGEPSGVDSEGETGGMGQGTGGNGPTLGGGGTTGSGGEGMGTGGGGDGLPGPFVYSEYDEDDRYMIDSLFVLTQQAYDEITEDGTDPRDFLDYRLEEEINAPLERSLVDNVVVRTLGYHVLTSEDYARTGNSPTDTLTNLDYVWGWLSSYRSTYGADKVLLIAGSEESESGAAWGGGDASSYWVDFLPIGHEYGHTMGGSHCNEGNAGSLQYGFPLAGYSAEGFPNEGGLTGGTMMCGNSAGFYSNPDLVLTMAQINAYVAEGVLPDQDYVAALGADGTLRMGDPLYANMAQVWRDNAPGAARNMFTMRYPGYEDYFYDKEDCAGFYGEEGFGQFLFEICEGDEQEGISGEGIASVKLGKNVQVSLYSDPAFGAGSTCGGLLQKLAFSSPSLRALAEHQGLPSLEEAVHSAAVYTQWDRAAHARFDGGFDFYATGDLPFCSTIEGEELTLLRDEVEWASTAAVLRDASIEIPYAIEFDYSSRHDADDNYADGFVAFFEKDGSAYQGEEPPRTSLGFIPDGTGYGLSLNIWTNEAALVDGNYSELDSAGMSAFTAGEWIAVRIEVRADAIVAFYDGAEILNAPVTLDGSFDHIGFSTGTGAYTAEYKIRDLSISPL